MKLAVCLALILSMFPSPAWSECDPKHDGDCCARDADCAAYPNRALCAVVALNHTKIQELAKENAPGHSFCTDEVMAKLKTTAAEAKVICLKGACEIWQDNG